MALRLTIPTSQCSRPSMYIPRMGLTARHTVCSTSGRVSNITASTVGKSRAPAFRTRVAASVLTPSNVDEVMSQEDAERDASAREFAVACAEVVDETKCQDITCLHVAPLVSWTSYMVFATVFSKPQLLAALARIESMVEDRYPERSRQNQPGSSPWECLDYGDVVVHLFTGEQRETYDVEGFYAAAEEVDLPFLAPPVGDQAPRWATQF